MGYRELFNHLLYLKPFKCLKTNELLIVLKLYYLKIICKQNIYIYIYIYIERERERDKEREVERELLSDESQWPNG